MSANTNWQSPSYHIRQNLPVSMELATSIQYQGLRPIFAQNVEAKRKKLIPARLFMDKKGKVERYYWREIFKTYCEYVLNWLQQNSDQVKDIIEFQSRFRGIATELKKKAKKHWQALDKQSPKYDLKERTEAEFLSQVPVPLIRIEAKYRQIEKNDQKIGKWINQSGQLASVEEIGSEWYRSKGYNILACERKFISTWVGTFLSLPIQDPSDLRVRSTFRNSTKGWTSHNQNSLLISILLPEDFGSPEYYKRREVAIKAGIRRMRTAGNLRTLFDELLDDSESLRDYLWVNDDKTVEVARIALNILPKETVVTSVEWAIQDFWHRQPGWPDLICLQG